MSSEPELHVLVVARDVEIRRRIAHALVADAPASPIQLEEVPDAAIATERFREGGIDVVLARLQPPDGLGAIASLRSAAPDVPLVALLATGAANAVAAAREAGAIDAVAEERLDGEVLRRTLRHAIERHRLQAQIHRHSVMDETTGVLNSRGFEQLAEHHMRMADRSKEPVVVVFVRVRAPARSDRERMASLARDTAVVLTRAVRDADVVGRLGPDTFAVLLSGDASGKQALVLSRIVEAVAGRNARSGRAEPLALEVGSVTYDPERRRTLAELIGDADRQMRPASPPT